MPIAQVSNPADNPLKTLEEWDEFLQERYPEHAAAAAL